MTETIHTYSDAHLRRLVAWCDANARAHPHAVAALGFAYGCGLNEHQLAHTRLACLDRPVLVDYPLARRAADIPTAERARLRCDEPDWLAEAADALARAHTQPAGYLFNPGTLRIPPVAQTIRDLISDAAREATGYRLSCAGLNRSRLAQAPRNGHEFAPFGLGYAPSWAARLITPEARPAMPRRG